MERRGVTASDAALWKGYKCTWLYRFLVKMSVLGIVWASASIAPSFRGLLGGLTHTSLVRLGCVGMDAGASGRSVSPDKYVGSVDEEVCVEVVDGWSQVADAAMWKEVCTLLVGCMDM